MDFDKRNRDSSQGVADGDAGVGKGGRIDKNERDILSGRFLDALYKHSLGVGLQVLGVMSTSRCEIRKPLVDFSQCHLAIVFRFSLAEQVQVRAVQNEKFGQGESSVQINTV